MHAWKSLRLCLLIATCGGVLWGLKQSIFLSPTSVQQTDSSFAFPAEIPLPGWQPLGSKTTVNSLGHIYRYSKGDLHLELEMYYVTDAKANQKYFRQYTPVSTDVSTSTIQQRNQMGFYSLSLKQEKAYLRTCINPRGQSTITYEQFLHNRYVKDLQFSRVLPWLLGQVTLRDHRCLWTHLSVPVKGKSPTPAYKTLETVWVPWHQWWQQHFPKP